MDKYIFMYGDDSYCHSIIQSEYGELYHDYDIKEEDWAKLPDINDNEVLFQIMTMGGNIEDVLYSSGNCFIVRDKHLNIVIRNNLWDYEVVYLKNNLNFIDEL